LLGWASVVCGPREFFLLPNGAGAGLRVMAPISRTVSEPAQKQSPPASASQDPLALIGSGGVNGVNGYRDLESLELVNPAIDDLPGLGWWLHLTKTLLHVPTSDGRLPRSPSAKDARLALDHRGQQSSLAEFRQFTAPPQSSPARK
jgi:hypothetical protein